jgi:hypothetical protein
MTNDDGEARRTTAKRGKEGKQSVRSYGYTGVTMLKGRTWRDKREEIAGEERATLLATNHKLLKMRPQTIPLKRFLHFGY